MASDNNKPTAKKLNPLLFVAGILIVLVLLGVAQFVAKGPASPDSLEVTTEETAQTDQTASETAVSTEPVTIDVNAALSDRILGSTSAPVKVSEHASFTCGHCAQFHKDTFKKFKEEYVDTGKAYIVFSDFPLNAPAVHASMVARCLPEAKYFDFVQMLFETQDKWAFEANYLDYLKEKAGEAGLDEPHFQACVQNTELQAGIVNRMKGIQAQWNINSTPSFVINNRTTLSGTYPYEEFKKVVEAELVGKKADNPDGLGASESAPASAEPPAPAATEETPGATTEEDPAPATETPEADAEDGSVVEDEATPDPTPVEEEVTPEPATEPATESEGSGETPAQ